MKKGQWIAIVVAVGVGTAFYFAPRTPNTAAVEVSPEALDSNDVKVKQAVHMIESGEGQPMQAILLLREVVESNPQHEEAQFQLGKFSLMSGQFDKAIARFKTVLDINSASAEAVEGLVQAYVSLGQHDQAIAAIDAFLQTNPNHSSKAHLEETRARLVQ